MIEDMSFKEGQTIWLLETSNSYRKTPKECIGKCVYRGKGVCNYGYKNDSIQLLINGKLGMTKGIGDGKLFETLEELKSYIIEVKLNDISNLQRSINNINSDIDEIKSLKDISEDRDKKLNTLLK